MKGYADSDISLNMTKLKALRIKLKQNDGYLTIETTMVFSMVFFALIFMLFIGMVLYQEVHTQSLAMQDSERGSVIYSSRASDMSGVKRLDDFLIRDPYRNVPFMDGSGKQAYTSLVNSHIDKALGRGNIIEGSTYNQNNYTEIEDYLLAKRVKVTISTGYSTPIDSLSEMFGHQGPFKINTTMVSAVTDHSDFIRNVDIVTDIIEQTRVFGTVEAGYKKIQDAIEGLKNFLN